MIQFLSISKKYSNDIVAVEDVSFEIEEGEFVFVVGPSGSGKTTLIRLLIREEKPTSGKIYFYDHDVTNFKQSQIYQLRRKIGVIFQDYKLIPELNAYENVAFAMEVAGRSDKEIKEQVPYLLDVVSLTHRMNFFPRQLSGGEKQRVAIARAMSNNPKVLIADEPTGNLDPESAWDIVQVLSKINNWGTTILMSTHGSEYVNSLYKRVIKMQDGKLVRDDLKGTYEELDDFSFKVVASTDNKKHETTKDINEQEDFEEEQEEGKQEEEEPVVEVKKKSSTKKNKPKSKKKKQTKLKQSTKKPKKQIKFSTRSKRKKKAKPHVKQDHEMEKKILEEIDAKIEDNEEALVKKVKQNYLVDLNLKDKLVGKLKKAGFDNLDDLIEIVLEELEKIDDLTKTDIKAISKVIEDFIKKQ